MSETPQPPDKPQTPGGTGKPRAGRALKIALALSMGVNLLILGVVGGAVLGRGGGPDEAPAIRMLGLGPFAFALSRDDRQEVRNRIEADLPALGRDRVALGHGLREVQNALLAEPFDRAAAEAALMRTRRAGHALQSRGHTALLDTLEVMSAADRVAVAERLGRALRRIGGRGGD